MNQIELRKLLYDETSEYPFVVIDCSCGRMYHTTWDTGLAIHEVRYERSAPQKFDTLELEQKCCPGISTKAGIKSYGVDAKYALTASNLEDPIVLTTFSCPSCGSSHPVLLDGRHRLYRALAENKPFLPAYLMPDGYMHSYMGITIAQGKHTR